MDVEGSRLAEAKDASKLRIGSHIRISAQWHEINITVVIIWWVLQQREIRQIQRTAEQNAYDISSSVSESISLLLLKQKSLSVCQDFETFTHNCFLRGLLVSSSSSSLTTRFFVVRCYQWITLISSEEQLINKLLPSSLGVPPSLLQWTSPLLLRPVLVMASWAYHAASCVAHSRLR